MDSDRYRCIFRSTIIVFEITGISAPYSFPTISYRFRFREKDVKMKVIWPPIDRFRSFLSLDGEVGLQGGQSGSQIVFLVVTID
jgi:hypothetical protein